MTDAHSRRSRAATVRTVALWVALVVVLTLAQLLRQSGAASWRTLWAEDGPVFLAGAPYLGSIVQGYAGYEHLLPRLIAVGSLPVPADWLARYFAFVPALVTAALAAAVYPFSARLVPSRLLRAILVAAVPLLPAAVDENLASATYSTTALMFVAYWALLAEPDRWWVATVAAVVAFLGAASYGLSLMLIPLALWLGWTRRDRRSRVVVGAFAAGLVLQGVVALSSSQAPGGRSDLAELAPLYVVRVFGSTLFGDRGTASLWVHGGYAYVAALAVVVPVVLVLLTRSARGVARWIGLVTIGYSILFFAVPTYGRGTVHAELSPTYLSLSYARFAMLGILLLMSGVFILFESTPIGEERRRLLTRAAAVYFALLVVSGFRFANPRSGGPEWRAELSAAQAECRSGRLEEVAIPITPQGWQVVLPCDRII